MTEEKLAEDISKINIETSGIVPKTPKNWNDLPPEIKLECIEFMNFKERTRLRQTSHTENCLVDALRYDFDYVELIGMTLSLQRNNPREHYSIPTQKSAFPKILESLNIGEFKKFGKFPITSNKTGLIRAKNFLPFSDFDSATALVKNLWNKTEMISLDLEEKPISIDEFMDIPQIRNVPDLQLYFVHKEQVVPLIQKWIEIDKELGSKLNINCDRDYSNELAAKFEFQKISQQSSTIRIGNGKHVRFEFEVRWRFEIHCTVISAAD